MSADGKFIPKVPKIQFYLIFWVTKKKPEVFSGKPGLAYHNSYTGNLGSNHPLCPFSHIHGFPLQEGILRQGRYEERFGLPFF